MGPNVEVAVDSEETFPLPDPVVPMNALGALRLGRVYWEQVEQTMRGLEVSRRALALSSGCSGRDPFSSTSARPSSRCTPDRSPARTRSSGACLREPKVVCSCLPRNAQTRGASGLRSAVFPAPWRAARPTPLDRVPLRSGSGPLTPSRRAEVRRTPRQGGSPVRAAVLGASGVIGHALVLAPRAAA